MIFKYAIEDVEFPVKYRFTFQSGDIQIIQEILSSKDLQDLHSNLVIFKSSTKIRVMPDVHAFTFQSGDIQIKSMMKC